MPKRVLRKKKAGKSAQKSQKGDQKKSVPNIVVMEPNLAKRKIVKPVRFVQSVSSEEVISEAMKDKVTPVMGETSTNREKAKPKLANVDLNLTKEQVENFILHSMTPAEVQELLQSKIQESLALHEDEDILPLQLSHHL